VPEIRRLLNLLGQEAAQQALHLHWSLWRRQHQWQAKQSHIRQRARQQGSGSWATSLSVDLLPDPLTIAGLPPLTAARWEQIAPLLPPQRPPTGRPASEHRQILEGMLWVMQAGTSWRQLPSAFGPWQTVYTRFLRWQREGLWAQIRCILLTPY
jgi:putative transposase of IS4/5 family DUF4096